MYKNKTTQVIAWILTETHLEFYLKSDSNQPAQVIGYPDLAVNYFVTVCWSILLTTYHTSYGAYSSYMEIRHTSNMTHIMIYNNIYIYIYTDLGLVKLK